MSWAPRRQSMRNALRISQTDTRMSIPDAPNQTATQKNKVDNQTENREGQGTKVYTDQAADFSSKTSIAKKGEQATAPEADLIGKKSEKMVAARSAMAKQMNSAKNVSKDGKSNNHSKVAKASKKGKEPAKSLVVKLKVRFDPNAPRVLGPAGHGSNEQTDVQKKFKAMDIDQHAKVAQDSIVRFGETEVESTESVQQFNFRAPRPVTTFTRGSRSNPTTFSRPARDVENTRATRARMLGMRFFNGKEWIGGESRQQASNSSTASVAEQQQAGPSSPAQALGQYYIRQPSPVADDE